MSPIPGVPFYGDNEEGLNDALYRAYLDQAEQSVYGPPKAPPQMAPSQNLGPISGRFLDDVSRGVLQGLQNSRPQGFGQNFAAGALGAFSSARQAGVEWRGQQYASQLKAQEEEQKGRLSERSAAARSLAQHRWQMQRDKQREELRAKTVAAGPKRGFGGQTVTLPDGTVVPMTAAMANAKAKDAGIIKANVSVANAVSPDVRRQANSIAKAIVEGRQAPEMTNMGRGGLAGEVRRILEEDYRYDLNTAGQDLLATKSFLRSANNPLSVRMRGSASTAFESTRLIDRLSEQLKKADPDLRGGVVPLNRARLTIAMNSPNSAVRSLARQLDGQIATVVFELGNVNMGGNSPTDQGMKRAQKELSSDWDEVVLKDMTELARENLRIRLNSINNVGAYTTKGINLRKIEEGAGGEPGGAPTQATAPATGEKNAYQKFLDEQAAKRRGKKP